MGIKITCDICGTEQNVIPCLVAQGAFLCPPHHDEFHKLVHNDMKMIADRVFEISNAALTTIRTNFHPPADNVIPLRAPE